MLAFKSFYVSKRVDRVYGKHNINVMQPYEILAHVLELLSSYKNVEKWVLLQHNNISLAV